MTQITHPHTVGSVVYTSRVGCLKQMLTNTTLFTPDGGIDAR